MTLLVGYFHQRNTQSVRQQLSVGIAHHKAGHIAALYGSGTGAYTNCLKLPVLNMGKQPAGKLRQAFDVGREVFRVKCSNFTFSLSGVQNKVQQFHAAHGNAEETAAYALRCVAGAVRLATENAMKAYPGLAVVFSGGVASNTMLRECLASLNPVFCPPQFSTDNAMGVAVLTHRMMEESHD